MPKEKRWLFSLVVDDVGEIEGLDQVLEVFQNQGASTAINWRTNLKGEIK